MLKQKESGLLRFAGSRRRWHMSVVQHRCKPVQWVVAKPFGLDRLDGGEHIVTVVAGAPVSLADDAELLVERQPAGILHMAAISDIGQRADTLLRRVVEPDRAHHFTIDVGGLLAGAQIFDGKLAQLGRDTEGDATAGAAAVEAQYQAWFFRGAAMIEGIDAERAVFANQTGRD